MEHKDYPILHKEIDGRVVKQLFNVTGVVDSVQDRTWPGSFAKTISERLPRIKVLWQHDMSAPPVGVPRLLKEIGRDELPADVTQKWPAANGALYGEIEYLDTARGNEVLEGIRKDAITENSIGFDAIKYDFEEDAEAKMQVRNLRENRLWDISPVNWGANDASLNMKAAPGASLQMLYRRIMAEVSKLDLTQKSREADSWLVAAAALEGLLADSYPDLLDVTPESKEGRVLSKNNLARLKAALDTLSEILLAAEPPKDEESAKALTARQELVQRALKLA